MGRSLYTPNTVAYLVHGVTAAAGSSTRSSSPSGSSSLADSGILSVGHEEIKYGNEQEQLAVRTSRRSNNNKDVPMSWAERSFDPDDENLPVVTERFLAPGEQHFDMVFGPVSDEEDAQEDQSDYGSAEQDDEDNVDGEEDDEHVRVETVEIERIIEEAERDAETELDEHEDLPHGNQGYYDFPTQDRRSTSEIANDASFSPSSAVFHAHTLPFSLPSTDAMQMQRRASSGNSSSSLARAL